MHPRLRLLFIIMIVVIAGTVVLVISQIRSAANITVRRPAQQLFSQIVPVMLASSTDPVLGNPGSPLDLVVYMNLADSDSRKIYPILTDFVRAHPTGARLFWKNAPRVGVFSDPRLAHQALWCAAEQKQFWPYVDALFKEPAGLSEADLITAATKITTLSQSLWKQCLHSSAAAQNISSAMSQAQALGLPRTPALFINNRLLNLDAGIDLKQMLATLVAP